MVLAGATAMAACGSESSDDTGNNTTGGAGGSAGSGGSGGSTAGSGGDGGGVTDPEMPGEQPPEPPTNGAAPTGDAVTFAVKKLYLGDKDRDGNESSTAWQEFGYNLDGIVSSKNGTNHCKPAQGANPAKVKTDGKNGIDNAFGASLLTLITGVAAGAADDINQSILDGSFTVMLHMPKFDDAADQTPVAAEMYAGANVGDMPPPTFDGSFTWLKTPGFKVDFPMSYVAGGTWVSGSRGNLSLSLDVQGFSLTLDIRQALVSMDIDSGNTGATKGIIAGVLDTEALIAELKKIAGAISPGLCEGSAFEGIAQQIRGASDINKDGTNDPTKDCDGISLGLGFDAGIVQLGGDAMPPEPPDDPCAM